MELALKLARIEELIMNLDGLFKSAKVRTASGKLFNHAVTFLYSL